MSKIKPIEGEDRHRIAELLSISPLEVPVAATKKCFKRDTAFDGSAFACGDNVIVLVNCQEDVVQLQGFLSVRNQGDFCSLLGQGVCYPFHLRDNGEAERNFGSDFCKG